MVTELMKYWIKGFTIFFVALILPACGKISQTAQKTQPAVEPTVSPMPAQSGETPTSSTPVDWSSYHNDQYGFTFDYPTIYATSSYQDSCGFKETSDGIQLGHQIELMVLKSNGLDLTEFVNQLLQTKAWTSDSQKDVIIDGSEAITADYRFGGTNRFGTFTIFKHDSSFFVFNFSGGDFCDIPAANITEPEAYSHILETFHFEP